MNYWQNLEQQIGEKWGGEQGKALLPVIARGDGAQKIIGGIAKKPERLIYPADIQ